MSVKVFDGGEKMLEDGSEDAKDISEKVFSEDEDILEKVWWTLIWVFDEDQDILEKGSDDFFVPKETKTNPILLLLNQ